MFRTTRRFLPALVALVGGLLWTGVGVSGQIYLGTPAPQSKQYSAIPSTKNGEWPHYTADIKGTRYSPLDQINASNFNKLEVAWRFKTDNFGPYPEYKLEGTPLMVKGVLYEFREKIIGGLIKVMGREEEGAGLAYCEKASST